MIMTSLIFEISGHVNGELDNCSHIGAIYKQCRNRVQSWGGVSDIWSYTKIWAVKWLIDRIKTELNYDASEDPF